MQLVYIHFVLSTSCFTWKVGLKYTGVELDYITDDKLRLLPENDMRGGAFSGNGNRYARRTHIIIIQD